MESDAGSLEWVRFQDFVRRRPALLVLAVVAAAGVVGNLLWWSVTQDRSQNVRIAVLIVNAVAAVPGLLSLGVGGWHARKEDSPPKWWRWRSGLLGWLFEKTR